MIAAIDGRTRVVTCSSVTFAPGLRTDLGAIGRACRSRDVLFLVDAVQSAGILSLDVSRDHIDALVASTAKGLLGMYGCGFLYCRRPWVQRLTPAYLSRPAVELPPERYSEMAGLDVAMRTDARRFEVGAVDYASCYAVDASLTCWTRSARRRSKRTCWRWRGSPARRDWRSRGSTCPRAPSGRKPRTSSRSGGWGGRPRHHRPAARAPVGAPDGEERDAHDPARHAALCLPSVQFRRRRGPRSRTCARCRSPHRV